MKFTEYTMGTRAVTLLDMAPGDTTCIYSTMMYVVEHAAQYNVTPISVRSALMAQSSYDPRKHNPIRSIVL